MYYRVPIIDGKSDYVDVRNFIQGLITNDGHSYVKMQPDTEVPPGWTEITEDEWFKAFQAGKLTADKHIITADGVDEAVVIATCPEGLSEITFYVNGTEVLRPVDQVTNEAQLLITSTSPGISIYILAGVAPVENGTNEVIINAN